MVEKSSSIAFGLGCIAEEDGNMQFCRCHALLCIGCRCWFVDVSERFCGFDVNWCCALKHQAGVEVVACWSVAVADVVVDDGIVGLDAAQLGWWEDADAVLACFHTDYV